MYGSKGIVRLTARAQVIRGKVSANSLRHMEGIRGRSGP